MSKNEQLKACFVFLSNFNLYLFQNQNFKKINKEFNASILLAETNRLFRPSWRSIIVSNFPLIMPANFGIS
jgi:hypothetical protein